jgi:hypothetical protein
MVSTFRHSRWVRHSAIRGGFTTTADIGGSPIRYKVGQSRGHIVSEDRLTQTSAGVLVVTNQRILLQPASGNKPGSITLTKVLSYNSYNNGIEVYKEGREKGYFFS